MAIRPNPFTFACKACGWKKTVAPQSDALGAGDWFSQCPKCGCQGLTMKPASGFEKLWVELWPRR